MKAGAERNVRYEMIPNVGDQAREIVETTDEKKGFLTDSAILVAQGKGLQLTLMSTQLAKRERTGGLKAFEELGRAATKRLEDSLIDGAKKYTSVEQNPLYSGDRRREMISFCACREGV